MLKPIALALAFAAGSLAVSTLPASATQFGSATSIIMNDRAADAIDYTQSLDPIIYQRFGCVRGHCNRH